MVLLCNPGTWNRPDLPKWPEKSVLALLSLLKWSIERGPYINIHI
jgi:hypothetical protein